jgi:hypothetical protein
LFIQEIPEVASAMGFFAHRFFKYCFYVSSPIQVRLAASFAVS